MLTIQRVLQVKIAEKKVSPVKGLTLVVNADGRLLESPLAMLLNQKITIGNPRTGKRVECRAIRSERTSPGSLTVVFELDEPPSKFWPISFPPED